MLDDIKQPTLRDRLRNAFRAFKGKPIQTICFGVAVKRCDECEYSKDRGLRDDLLVTTGARAAYMEDQGHIVLPHGVDGESKLAQFASRIVDHYLYRCGYMDITCDEYIEKALYEEYGVRKGVKEV